MKKTYIKTFPTKREAWAHMCAKNKRNDGEMYVLVHGATHYRDFTRAQVGYNSKGELKTRFKADDGLMYSRI